MLSRTMPKQITAAAAWFSRLVLPLPNVCQEFLYHRALDNWLNEHPTVKNALVWDFESGPLPYASWPVDRKRPLQRSFPFGYPFELQDPPPNLAIVGDTDFPRTILSESDAWKIYLNYVAQSLANDFWGAFAWSLDDLSDYGRALLLDGRSFFNRLSEGYEIDQWEAGLALLAPPHVAYQFLQTYNLIGASRLDTIGRTLDWCRSNLVHFAFGYEALNMEYQWQYRGFPPVSRIINGTPWTDPRYSDTTLRHRTAGCHGTSGFLTAILRVLNIPVRYARPPGSGHATPIFVSEARYMSHGDDPYNAYAKATPPFPAVDLVFDHVTYDAWFPSGAPDPNVNIGRRVYELALIHLPDSLLRAHCADVAAGRNHASSDVYQTFSRWYSVAELEAMGLWNRLDAKVTSFGGCGYIP